MIDSSPEKEDLGIALMVMPCTNLRIVKRYDNLFFSAIFGLGCHPVEQGSHLHRAALRARRQPYRHSKAQAPSFAYAEDITIFHSAKSHPKDLILDGQQPADGLNR